MLKAAVDVYYREQTATAVCLLFEHWEDENPTAIYSARIKDVADYQPGEFYKRELPCILKVLEQVNLSGVECIVADGYVFLNDSGKWGLGAHLYHALAERLPVIGFAKTRFHNNEKRVVQLRRGNATRPLFISTIGIDITVAASYIAAMAGPYRIPTLLRYLDEKTREL